MTWSQRTDLPSHRQRCRLLQPPFQATRRGLHLLELLAGAAVLVGMQAVPVIGATALSSGVVQATATHPPSAVASGQVASRSPKSASAKLALHNIAPHPNFLLACGLDLNTAACRDAEIKAINNARRSEALRPLDLNVTAFNKLSASEQVFVVTDLERLARNLSPVAAMTAQLNASAKAGAKASTDPALKGWVITGHKSVTSWVSNWAGGLSVLGADYFWMYDDGVGFNVSCTATSSSGCWAHRDNVLVAAPTLASCTRQGGTPELLMGVAVEPRAYHGATGIAQLITTSCGGLPDDITFTWQTAKRLVMTKSE